MDRAGYGVAASIGVAVGLGASGWLLGSALALLVGAVLTGAGIAPEARHTGPRPALLAFFDQPLKLWHAVTWCVSLVCSSLFVRVWG